MSTKLNTCFLILSEEREIMTDSQWDRKFDAITGVVQELVALIES